MLNTNSFWKKVLYMFLIIFALLILDNTIVTFFSIKGVFPSLLFSFIICYSIVSGYEEAIVIGVFSGILQDIYFPGALGINVLINMLTCLIAAKVGKSIFKEKIFVPLISTFLLSVLKSGYIFAILILTKNKNDFSHLILYKAIYETAITLLIYKLVLKFSETKIIKKEWRF